MTARAHGGGEAVIAARQKAIRIATSLLPHAHNQALAGKPRLLEHLLHFISEKTPHVHLHPA